MFPSRRLRVVLHLLLVAVLAIPGIAAPARAVADEVQAIAAEHEARTGEPCDMHEAPAAEMPCDCCTPRGCDLSACLGVSCLPTLPQVAGAPPPRSPVVGWSPPSVAIVVLDAPLRPPIA